MRLHTLGASNECAAVREYTIREVRNSFPASLSFVLVLAYALNILQRSRL